MFGDAPQNRRCWSGPKSGRFSGCQHSTRTPRTIYTPFLAMMIFSTRGIASPTPFVRSNFISICYKTPMHFDWNIDEINELKKRAEVHGEDKSIKRHL
ncbi:MAG: hypothetical protein WCD79_03355 [Chthoniobacteraceae bacterium]